MCVKVIHEGLSVCWAAEAVCSLTVELLLTTPWDWALEAVSEGRVGWLREDILNKKTLTFEHCPKVALTLPPLIFDIVR